VLRRGGQNKRKLLTRRVSLSSSDSAAATIGRHYLYKINPKHTPNLKRKTKNKLQKDTKAVAELDWNSRKFDSTLLFWLVHDGKKNPGFLPSPRRGNLYSVSYYFTNHLVYIFDKQCIWRRKEKNPSKKSVEKPSKNPSKKRRNPQISTIYFFFILHK